MDIGLRFADVSDAKIVQELASKTFYETFKVHNTTEDMENYLNEHFNLESVKKDLSDKSGVFILAFKEETLVAYAKMRNVEIVEELSKYNYIEIQRLYVLKDYQRFKIGSKLMEFCLNYAKEQGYDTVWLGVWEHNYNALKFYEKWEFKVFGNHIFVLGDDEQIDIMVKKHI